MLKPKILIWFGVEEYKFDEKIYTRPFWGQVMDRTIDKPPEVYVAIWVSISANLRSLNSNLIFEIRYLHFMFQTKKSSKKYFLQPIVKLTNCA
jgi:hypothetical protein